MSYSFLDVSAILTGPGGSISLGAGAGITEEGISVDPVDTQNNMSIGADGTPMHSLSANKGATIRVRVQKTSPVNQKLMAMFNLQTATGSLHGQNTLVVATLNGGDVVSCTKVAFQSRPGLTYSKNAGLNEWTFDAGRCDFALGSGYEG